MFNRVVNTDGNQQSVRYESIDANSCANKKKKKNVHRFPRIYVEIVFDAINITIIDEMIRFPKRTYSIERYLNRNVSSCEKKNHVETKIIKLKI